MAQPFLTQDFHPRWSTLDIACIQADITTALKKAESNINDLADQDRGKMNFDSVVIGLDDATRPLNVAKKLIAEAFAFTCAFDDSWNVGDYELGCVV